MLLAALAVAGVAAVAGLIVYLAYRDFGARAKAKVLSVVKDVEDAKAAVEKAASDVKKDLSE